MSLRVAVTGRRRFVTQSRPQDRSADASQHFPQAIRRWGNSLAVRLPADCRRQAGLQEDDQIDIVVGPDGRLSLEPLRRLDCSALATDLRQLQATMPLTPSVIEECRGGERWPSRPQF
jgi:antitoxin MazE